MKSETITTVMKCDRCGREHEGANPRQTFTGIGWMQLSFNQPGEHAPHRKAAGLDLCWECADALEAFLCTESRLEDTT